MIVTGEDGDTLPRLPIPDSDSLIVRGGEDPGVFVVKVDGTDVVEMTVESEETTPRLVAVCVK